MEDYIIKDQRTSSCLSYICYVEGILYRQNSQKYTNCNILQVVPTNIFPMAFPIPTQANVCSKQIKASTISSHIKHLHLFPLQWDFSDIDQSQSGKWNGEDWDEETVLKEIEDELRKADEEEEMASTPSLSYNSQQELGDDDDMYHVM